MNSSFYRKDIQGLRGVAIFLVLIYHFFPIIAQREHSGLLGVDLFFIISGYLITLIFFKNSKINFFYFFFKRLYRVIPSIVFIIFFSSIVSIYLFLPNDLSKFWDSLISAVFLLPNYYFLFDGGYFGGDSKYKPLLHLWSLGVEIQFYFFYPFLLLLIKRLKNKNYILYISLFFLISLVICLFFININLNKVAFLSIPTRLWQFCLGSLLYFLPQIKISYNYKYTAYLSSLILIFIISAISNPNINFVSTQLLVSFFGSIIIYFGNEIKKDNYFLGNFIFQFLGKISFSLYLVHWPVLVFAKYYFIEILNEQLLILLLITLLLSFLFYLFIESKFRLNFTIFSGFKYLLKISFFFVIFAILFFLNFNPEKKKIDNVINNFSTSIDSNYRCNSNTYLSFNNSKNCKIIGNKQNFVYEVGLFGNSHAQMYGYSYEKLLETKKLNGLIFPMQKCLPTTTINVSIKCLKLANKNFNDILSNKNLKYVFIGLNWDHNLLINSSGKIENNFNSLLLANSILELVHDFEKAGIKSFVIGPISQPNYDIASVESRKLKFGHKTEPINFRETKFEFEQRYVSVFNLFKEKNFKRLIKTHEVQCESGKCVFSNINNSLFSDSHHLSKYGSMLMSNIFLKSFEIY